MIFGVGIDMIETERIAEKVGKDNGFRELVFSANEIEYCESKTHKFEHYAARFAAKEAFFKALGTGWLGASFNEVEVTNDDKGKPSLVFSGETSKMIGAMDLGSISVSLSHVKTMATAIVIIEK